jgi:hypothetical protein
MEKGVDLSCPRCDFCGRPLTWRESQEHFYYYTFQGHTGLLLVCSRCFGEAGDLLPPNLRPARSPWGGLAYLFTRRRL